MTPTDLLGYVASGLVILSLSMRSVVRLRVISLCASVTFFIYGALIGAIPIMITNGSLIVLNTWFLSRELFQQRNNRDNLGVSRIRSDSPFLLDFVEFHLDDIRKFQPSFTMPTGDNVVSLLLNRDGLPAGLLIGRRRSSTEWNPSAPPGAPTDSDGDTLRIDLDYVLREHRDSRLGKWLYSGGSNVFRELGITSLTADAATPDHRKYLERVGFAPVPDSDRGHYALAL